MEQRSAAPGAITHLLLPELRDTLTRSPEVLADAISEIHESDLAELASALLPDEQSSFFKALPFGRATDVLVQMDDAIRRNVLVELDDQTAVALLNAAEPDDRADMIARLPSSRGARILAALAQAVRAETADLMAYPPTTAGGLMTPEFVTLPQMVRVKQALALVRKAARDKETISALYVTGSANTLLGVVTVQELLAADDGSPVGEVADRHFQCVSLLTDQEEVANIILKYDLLAIPVVDDEKRIRGIVTVDDIVDVVVQEATEDVQRLGGVEPIEDSYFQAGFWSLVRNRGLWLLVLLGGGLLASWVLREFEGSFAGALILVAFIPLILSSGGNTGTQSATLITRGLAVGEIQTGDVYRVCTREALMGLALGVLLGTIGVMSAMLWSLSARVAAVLGITLAAVVTVGSVLGALLPMMFKRLGVDPALASTPFVASLIDVVGIVLYMTVARLLLGV